MDGGMIATLNVFIGACLGFGATFLGQYFTEKRLEVRNKRKIYHQRLEGFVEAIFDADDWLTERLNRILYAVETPYRGNPQKKAQMLMSLYFPHLIDNYFAFSKTSTALMILIDSQKPLKEKNLPWEAEKYTSLYADYFKAKTILVDRIREEMQKS